MIEAAKFLLVLYFFLWVAGLVKYSTRAFLPGALCFLVASYMTIKHPITFVQLHIAIPAWLLAILTLRYLYLAARRFFFPKHLGTGKHGGPLSIT